MPPAGRERRWAAIMAAPAVLLVVLFAVAPLAASLIRAMQRDGALTFANFADLAEPPYAQVLLDTVGVALLVTALSLAIAIPACDAIASRKGASAYVFIGLVAASMWISYIAKIYAWQVLLAMEGPLNGALLAAGIVDAPIPFLYTRLAVILATVQVELPFATLIVYAGMRQVDHDLIAATRSLGAGALAALRHSYWPQLRPSIALAALVTFLHTLGVWVAPAILGGPADVMAGQQIAAEIVHKIDPRMASVLGTVTAVTMALVAWVALRSTGLSLHRMVPLRGPDVA